MQRKKIISIGEKDITIRELTVAQVKNLMEELSESKEVNTMDFLFPDNLPAVAIAESTGIPVKKLEQDFVPSELQQIIEKVEALNPFFASMITRLAKVGQAALKEKEII